MMIKLIYVGTSFYLQSGTVLSSIHREDGTRFHWGFVEASLRNGHEVHIRPATTEELGKYRDALAKLQP